MTGAEWLWKEERWKGIWEGGRKGKGRIDGRWKTRRMKSGVE